MLKKKYLLPEAGTGYPTMHSRFTWSFSVASFILLASDESLTCVLRQIFGQIFWYLNARYCSTYRDTYIQAAQPLVETIGICLYLGGDC
jgi:hypothetical protein